MFRQSSQADQEQPLEPELEQSAQAPANGAQNCAQAEPSDAAHRLLGADGPGAGVAEAAPGSAAGERTVRATRAGQEQLKQLHDTHRYSTKPSFQPKLEPSLRPSPTPPPSPPAKCIRSAPSTLVVASLVSTAVGLSLLLVVGMFLNQHHFSTSSQPHESTATGGGRPPQEIHGMEQPPQTGTGHRFKRSYSSRVAPQHDDRHHRDRQVEHANQTRPNSLALVAANQLERDQRRPKPSETSLSRASHRVTERQLERQVTGDTSERLTASRMRPAGQQSRRSSTRHSQREEAAPADHWRPMLVAPLGARAGGSNQVGLRASKPTEKPRDLRPEPIGFSAQVHQSASHKQAGQQQQQQQQQQQHRGQAHNRARQTQHRRPRLQPAGEPVAASESSWHQARRRPRQWRRKPDSTRIYKKVLLCEKTLVSLDYLRASGSSPGPSSSPALGPNELELGGEQLPTVDEIMNEIGDLEDNFLDQLDNQQQPRLAMDLLARRQDQGPAPSGGANGTAPLGEANSTLAGHDGQLAADESVLLGSAGEPGRRSWSSEIRHKQKHLSDEDALIRCDMWDLEKGIKSRRPSEEVLRVAVRADFETVREAINRCRQLSERSLGQQLGSSLAADDDQRLELMSTEDLISLFSMKRGLIPGTKWCGLGDQANSYNDLGPKHRIDICCRAHDHCPIRSKPFRNNYGVLNIGLYTKSHCDCDADFYRCLREVRSRTADMLGNLYFNVMKLQCMREERLKVCREMKPIALGFERCIRYEDSPIKRVFKFTTPPVAY